MNATELEAQVTDAINQLASLGGALRDGVVVDVSPDLHDALMDVSQSWLIRTTLMNDGTVPLLPRINPWMEPGAVLVWPKGSEPKIWPPRATDAK